MTAEAPAGADDLAPAAVLPEPPPMNVFGWSRLDDHVLLADASLAMAMAQAGADVLIDLRGETKPPRLPIQIEHFPIEDLMPGQEALILAAAQRVRELVGEGRTVGIYCQAGVSRTSTVAIAYQVLGGVPLQDALAHVRRIRPQAMPALELWHSLERLAGEPVDEA
jgi:Dual specificity phosphatase, catalytic domain